MIVTIDGPAGSGKSTVAKMLATELGFIHLNSGQIFRALTAWCLANQLFEQGDDALSRAVCDCEINCFEKEGRVHWSINGSDMTEKLTLDSTVRHVSRLAALAAVREFAKKWQRQWAAGKNVVVEGRDAGSAVFQTASIKIYITANLQTRAKRRFDQMNAREISGTALELKKVEIDLKRRDDADLSRAHDPLVCPTNALTLDTTDMTAAAAASQLCQLIRNCLAAKN